MFSLIADEATDAATMEQMSLCVRYVCNDEVQEDFLGFAECSSTTGEYLANAFLENLVRIGVQTAQMVGQGYDGAGNMSGKRKGVQARIQQQIPNAVYTHCKAHCLNLAIVHACSETFVKNMMGTVQTVAFAFNYSAKRLLKYQIQKKAIHTTDILRLYEAYRGCLGGTDEATFTREVRKWVTWWTDGELAFDQFQVPLHKLFHVTLTAKETRHSVWIV
ncbi:zinc finger MYM-type protein 1-like [Ruditapes philippinarum]|uniref:zinc finger MYM-type protein 1-like n=1 Tax=Ruditapes philippinarum TaxID=129788 RepID=UPI00295BC130|nr:zinc finger MYM-type protein 1-like [Ruditapes philippinarum]